MGRSDRALIGPRIVVPFRVHHLHPDDFLRRPFLDTNEDVAALAILPLLTGLWVPLETTQVQESRWRDGFCTMGAMTTRFTSVGAHAHAAACGRRSTRCEAAVAAVWVPRILIIPFRKF
jgi:hypothetical protein